jgi:hypothetical protein
MAIKERLKQMITITRGQYFLNFLIGFFAGVCFMWFVTLIGLVN